MDTEKVHQHDNKKNDWYMLHGLFRVKVKETKVTQNSFFDKMQSMK